MLYFVLSYKPPALLINRPMSLESYDYDEICDVDGDGQVDNEDVVASDIIGYCISEATDIGDECGY
jgi:hypothetical protein